MSKITELEAQVQALQNILAAHGLVPRAPVVPDKERGDYIEFGSAKHAAFLGLVEVENEDDANGRISFRSPTSGKVWTLEDEVTQFVNYPNPAQAALLVLRQKVSSLESGPPQIPPGAPELWQPADMM